MQSSTQPWLNSDSRFIEPFTVQSTSLFDNPYYEWTTGFGFELIGGVEKKLNTPGFLSRQNLRHIGLKRYGDPKIFLPYRATAQTAAKTLKVFGRVALGVNILNEGVNFYNNPTLSQGLHSGLNIAAPLALAAIPGVGIPLALGYVAADLIWGDDIWGTGQ